MSRTRNPKDWIATSAMAQELGCSIDHLYRLRDTGELKRGTHWYCLNQNAARLTYRWHKKRVEQALGIS
jgi:hypothetical protein